MAKYIDADKLRKLLANHYEEITVPVLTDEGGLESFYRRSEIHNILNILDSLQQEQQDLPITDEEVEKFLATHPKVEVPDKYKTPDWLFKKQEKQEVDLEKEIEEYRMVNEWSESIPLNLFKVIARYFYGLGQLNSK